MEHAHYAYSPHGQTKMGCTLDTYIGSLTAINGFILSEKTENMGRLLSFKNLLPTREVKVFFYYTTQLK